VVASHLAPPPDGQASGITIRDIARSTLDRYIRAFDGPAVFRQALDYTPRKPWRKVRFVQLRVPVSAVSVGWVAWPEIEVFSR